jgi:hypothetical protein
MTFAASLCNSGAAGALCWSVQPSNVLLPHTTTVHRGPFPVPPTPPHPQNTHKQFIQLAGLTGTTATSRLRAASSGRDACLPGPVPRPPGPLALLGPRQGNLWLVNSLGQPMMLPLTHPGVWTHCLHVCVASGSCVCTQGLYDKPTDFPHDDRLMPRLSGRADEVLTYKIWFPGVCRVWGYNQPQPFICCAIPSTPAVSFKEFDMCLLLPHLLTVCAAPAGIRARCLCAQGDLVGAVAVGRKGLAPCQHDSLAGFLALQGGVAGAHLSLMGLQGLSLDMEAELCMVTGACVCVWGGGGGGHGVDWMTGGVGVPRRGPLGGGSMQWAHMKAARGGGPRMLARLQRMLGCAHKLCWLENC